MVSRYDNRRIGVNATEQYEELLENRAVKRIRQYLSPKLRHPTIEESGELQVINHSWKVGDKYFKLADKYYGSPQLWWVIAHYNQKPTEAHLKIGDVVEIPLPLDLVLKFLGM